MATISESDAALPHSLRRRRLDGQFGVRTILGAGLLLAVAFPPANQASDWFRWRGPDLNGISQETNWTAQWPQEGPKPLWKAAVGIGFSSMAVSQGRVFTMGNASNQDTVFCLNADSGAVLWKYSYPCGLRPQYYEGGTSATPTVDGDRVYTLGKEGQLFCFEASTGKVIWNQNLVTATGAPMPRWGFASSPLVRENLLIVNVGTAGTALDKATGRVVWSSAKGPAGYASAVPLNLRNEPCLLFFSAKALVCVTLQDGRELWTYPWVTKWDLNVADPIVSGDHVLISSFDRGTALLQVDAQGANVIWQSKELANHFNASVLYQGHLYGIDGNTDSPPAKLRCLDFATGTLKWSYPGLGFGSLLIANGQLIVLSDKGELVIGPANPDAFKPVARAQVLGNKCWTTPVLSHGRLYCRNAQGILVCLDARSPSL